MTSNDNKAKSGNDDDKTAWMDGDEDYFTSSFFSKKNTVLTNTSDEQDASPSLLSTDHLLKSNTSTIPATFFEFEAFGSPVKIKQDARECCGGYAWRAAAVLIKYLENRNVFAEGVFKDKRILEVGSGTGMVGIALSKAGGRMVLTDQKVALPLLQENNEINNNNNNNNSSSSSSVVAELSWFT
eukprot:TRINITY_DN7312_c0_g2_i1.p1 TRINITY_DN7312_c0_g2~~TRINITY_DN7312_c0_g2_i1.p1  ORF type:complete len:197 (-),score=79.65 TRINITY_DN7312_c0_g2_i1:27-578(-)